MGGSHVFILFPLLGLYKLLEALQDATLSSSKRKGLPGKRSKEPFWALELGRAMMLKKGEWIFENLKGQGEALLVAKSTQNLVK
jgi:hypothetical protein